MTGIVIAGHGDFPAGLLQAVEIIAGRQENIAAVSFQLGQGMEELKEAILKAVETIKGGDILLLTDIMGGSPFNASAELLAGNPQKHIKVVAGANMPAVVQAVFSRAEGDLDTLADEVAKAGRDGLVNLDELFRKART